MPHRWDAHCGRSASTVRWRRRLWRSEVRITGTSRRCAPPNCERGAGTEWSLPEHAADWDAPSCPDCCHRAHRSQCGSSRARLARPVVALAPALNTQSGRDNPGYPGSAGSGAACKTSARQQHPQTGRACTKAGGGRAGSNAGWDQHASPGTVQRSRAGQAA